MNEEYLNNIQQELRKRHSHPYNWGRQQNNVWDKASNFIYSEEKWEQLQNKITTTQESNSFPASEFFNYCINRWYNFHSAKAVEHIFESLNLVEKITSEKHHSIDFHLNSIPFDLKTSVFPAGFKQNLQYAQNNPEKLISWLYANQSIQGRFHQANRLFLIVYSQNGQHWKLKSEILWLKGIIEEYVLNFDASHLKNLTFSSGNSAVSDIIWAIR